MADMLRDGVDYLLTTLFAVNGHEVNYARGASSVDIDAAVTKRLVRVGDDYGDYKTVFTERDYVIRASDLDFGAGSFKPVRGDVITDSEDEDGVTQTWTVLSPGGDEPVYQQHKTLLRVHCKLRTEA